MSDVSLYARVCCWANLLLAYRKASRGKRGKSPAARFEYHLEDNLITLQAELQDKTYQPGTYHSFYIHDPKHRLISAAPFRDRVVHHALCNIIEPIFERSFIFDSYTNRVGKGNHRALDRAQHFARHYRYALPQLGAGAGTGHLLFLIYRVTESADKGYDYYWTSKVRHYETQHTV
jgi:RNA-directed DNA polymerase